MCVCVCVCVCKNYHNSIALSCCKYDKKKGATSLGRRRQRCANMHARISAPVTFGIPLSIGKRDLLAFNKDFHRLTRLPNELTRR